MEHKLIFKEKKQVGENLYTFVFEKPKDMSWISGQHGPLVFHDELPEDRGKRTLSIASSVKEDNVRFLLKIEEQRSNYKQALLDLQPGNDMTFVGPVGIFYPKDTTKKLIFIAGGVGVAPFRPMLYDCAQGNDNMNIELVYASTKGNFAFKDEFDAFAKKSDAIAIHYADEREAAKKITEELIEKHGNDAQYFISGAPSMVEEFKQVVLNKNISEENIVLDIFTGY